MCRAISTLLRLWAWCVILVARMRFRRTLSPDRIASLPIRVPFHPLGSFVALAIGPVWIVLLGIAYTMFHANRAGAPASTQSWPHPQRSGTPRAAHAHAARRGPLGIDPDHARAGRTSYAV